MRKFLLLVISALLGSQMLFAAKSNTIKITATPQTAAIYVNNQHAGYGFAEISRPTGKDKRSAIIIRMECEGYKTLETKIYADDKRTAVSYTMQEDGFYNGTVASGIVNKYLTVTLDNSLYTIDEQGTINVAKAWKLLHQILLNYFEEIATTDFSGGFVQTPWHYKASPLADRQIRIRVTARDISTLDKVAIQIKISSEVASAIGGRHGEFQTVDRIAKEWEPMLQELQTRLGKMHNN